MQISFLFPKHKTHPGVTLSSSSPKSHISSAIAERVLLQFNFICKYFCIHQSIILLHFHNDAKDSGGFPGQTSSPTVPNYILVQPPPTRSPFDPHASWMSVSFDSRVASCCDAMHELFNSECALCSLTSFPASSFPYTLFEVSDKSVLVIRLRLSGSNWLYKCRLYRLTLTDTL